MISTELFFDSTQEQLSLLIATPELISNGMCLNLYTEKGLRIFCRSVVQFHLSMHTRLGLVYSVFLYLSQIKVISGKSTGALKTQVYFPDEKGGLTQDFLFRRFGFVLPLVTLFQQQKNVDASNIFDSLVYEFCCSSEIRNKFLSRTGEERVFRWALNLLR